MHKFKSIEEIYDAFTAECNAAWNDAYELFPEFNAGGEDTDNAVEYLLEELEFWLEENKGYENGAAHEFLYNQKYCLNRAFDFNAEGIAESMYAGLT